MDSYNQYGSYGQGRPPSYGQSVQQPPGYGAVGGQQAAGQQANTSAYGQSPPNYPVGYSASGTSGGYTGAGASYQLHQGSYGSGNGTGGSGTTYGASGGGSTYGSGSSQFGATGSNAGTYSTGSGGPKYSSSSGAPNTYGAGTGPAPSSYQAQTNYSANPGGTYGGGPGSSTVPPGTNTGTYSTVGASGYLAGTSTYGSGGIGTYGTTGSIAGSTGVVGTRPTGTGAYGSSTGPSAGAGAGNSSAAAGSSAGGPYGTYGASNVGATQPVPGLYSSSAATGAAARPGGAAAQALAHMPAEQQSKLVSMVQQQNAYGQTGSSGAGAQSSYGSQQQTQPAPSQQQQTQQQQQYGAYGQSTGMGGSSAAMAAVQQGGANTYGGNAPRAYSAVPTTAGGANNQTGGSYGAQPSAQTPAYGAGTGSSNQPPAVGYGGSSTAYGSNHSQPATYGSTPQQGAYGPTAAQPSTYGQSTGQQSAYGATAGQQAAATVPGLGTGQPTSSYIAGASYGAGAGSSQQTTGARQGGYASAQQQPVGGVNSTMASHPALPGLHGGSGSTAAYAPARQAGPPTGQGQYGAGTYNASTTYAGGAKPPAAVPAPTSTQPQQPAYGPTSYTTTKHPVVGSTYGGGGMGSSAGTASPPGRGPAPAMTPAGGPSGGAGPMGPNTGPGSSSGGPGPGRYYPQGSGGPGVMGPGSMGPMGGPPGARVGALGPMSPMGGGPPGPVPMGRPGPYGGPPPMREDDRGRGAVGLIGRRDYDDRGPGPMRGGPPPPPREFRDRDRDFRDRDRDFRDRESRDREARDRDYRDRDTRDVRDARDGRDRDRSDRDRQPAPLPRDRDRDRDRDRRPSPPAPSRRDRDDVARRPQPRSPSPIPAATARAPPPRRRSPSPPPAAAATRPKLPDYGVRVSQHCLTTVERDYLELMRRYSHLAVPSDFSRLVCTWVRSQPGPVDSLGISMLPLDRHIRYDHEQDLTRSALTVPGEAGEAGYFAHGRVKYVAKVLLVQGLSPSTRQDVLLGPHHEGGAHLVSALKFVAARFSRQQPVTGGDEREGKDKDKDGSGKDKQRGVLGAMGGTWDQELDGGDPSSEDGGLTRACIRHVKDQAGVDLSACAHWLRVCEVNYLRTASAAGSSGNVAPLSTSMSDPSLREVVVLFAAVPDACVVGPDAWPEEARQQQAFKQQRLALEAESKKKEDAATARKDKDGIIEKEKTKDEKRDNKEEDASPAAVAEGSKDHEADNMLKDADKDKEVDKVDKEVDKDAAAISPAPLIGTVREVPLSDEPGIQLRGRAGAGVVPGCGDRVKTFSISLHGLLDYDETDRDEPTFELSVFAECFQDMLARDYGGTVYAALVAERHEFVCLSGTAALMPSAAQTRTDAGHPGPVGKRGREESDGVEHGRAGSEAPEGEKEVKKPRREGDLTVAGVGGVSSDSPKIMGVSEEVVEPLLATDAPTANNLPEVAAPAAGDAAVAEVAAAMADMPAIEEEAVDAGPEKTEEVAVEEQTAEESTLGKPSKAKGKGRAARGRGRGRGARGDKGRKAAKPVEETPDEEPEAEQDSVTVEESTAIPQPGEVVDEELKVKTEPQPALDPDVKVDVEMANEDLKTEPEVGTSADMYGGPPTADGGIKEAINEVVTKSKEPTSEGTTPEADDLKVEAVQEADMDIDNQEASTPPPPPPPPPAHTAPPTTAAASSPPKDAREGSAKPPGIRSSSRDAKDVRDKDRDREKEREKERKQRKKYVTDNNLLLAFRFFDRTGCGYIRTDDLRRLLHSLGLGLPNRMVKELVRGGWEEIGLSCRFKGDKLYYRDLTDKEVKGEQGGPSALEGSEPPSMSQLPAAAVAVADGSACREGSEGALEHK